MKIKEEHKIEKLSAAAKKTGEVWSGMSDKDKKKYEALHAKDKVRYEKQCAELEKNGFFKMDDGSKSSDHKPKKKLGKRTKAEATQEVEAEEEPEEEVAQEEEVAEPPKKKQRRGKKN